MSDTHPLLRWARRKEMSVSDIAAAAGCTDSYIRNICAGRREPSLSLAKRLSDLSGGKVPMAAFVRDEARA